VFIDNLREKRMDKLEQRLRDAVRGVFARTTAYASEDAFQSAFAQHLGSCKRELRAHCAAPLYPWRRPPQSAIDALAGAKQRRVLPPEGRDPCAHGAKLDVLWMTELGPVAIELKYRTKWKSDTYGYMFLKDLHRLERMTMAGTHPLAEQRFAIFVTNESVYWKGGRPEPEPFWLTDGTRRNAGCWVQYDQTSPDTLWYSYPPFYLANPYTLRWEDLGAAGRYLLVPVTPQVRLQPASDSRP
jgi:hypothetical protein